MENALSNETYVQSSALGFGHLQVWLLRELAWRRRHTGGLMTPAVSSGLGHVVKSALGMALRFASAPMILGSTQFTRTPAPFQSAANELIIANAAAFEAI